MNEELHPSIKRLLEKPTTEDERAQELLRASFTRARLTEAEREVSRGVVLQETALGNLVTAVRDGNEEAALLSRWHLADALALTGNFEGASLLHPIKEERERYRAIKEAVEKDDSEFCDCKPERVTLNGVDIDVPTTNINRMIYSPKRGDMVGLEICKCGATNARPLNGIYATAASTAGKPDIQLLKANG